MSFWIFMTSNSYNFLFLKILLTLDFKIVKNNFYKKYGH